MYEEWKQHICIRGEVKEISEHISMTQNINSYILLIYAVIQ